MREEKGRRDRIEEEKGERGKASGERFLVFWILVFPQTQIMR